MIYDPRFIKLAPIECGDTYTIYRVVYAPERKSPTLLGEMQVGRLSPETGYMIVKPYDLDHSLSRYFDLDYFTFPDTPAHLRYHTAALMSAVTNVDLANKIDCEHIARIVTRIRRGLTRAKNSNSTARFDLFGEQLTGAPFDSCFMQLRTNWRGRNDEEYAFVSLFKESHLSDKNLSLGAAHDDYDGRYRKVAAIAWLLAREGRSALRSFES